MNLSKHFTLDEFILSDYAVRNGIDNTPGQSEILNLKTLCELVLEPLREIVKSPIHITSGFRSSEVNRGIGGAANSQHVEGKAADIIVPGMSIDELFELASKFVPYDQVIHEFGRWVHISFTEPPRKMKLRAVKESGKTVYKSV